MLFSEKCWLISPFAWNVRTLSFLCADSPSASGKGNPGHVLHISLTDLFPKEEGSLVQVSQNLQCGHGPRGHPVDLQLPAFPLQYGYCLYLPLVSVVTVQLPFSRIWVLCSGVAETTKATFPAYCSDWACRCFVRGELLTPPIPQGMGDQQLSGHEQLPALLSGTPAWYSDPFIPFLLFLLLFSHSVVSNSLWSHELWYTRLPCPLLSPGVCSYSCLLNPWCHPTISSSVFPLSSCPQSFPTSGSFPVSQLFASGGQSIGAQASASVLMNIQGWFHLGLTGLISLLSKAASRVFSSTTIWKRQFFNAQPSLWSNSHICM